jgi:hypothetical protein
MPIGSQFGFNSVDADGNPTAAITNQLVNFGWEYVWHCHILSHEEMDMMRPVSLVLPPNAPNGLASTITGNGNNQHVVLTWNDNSISETSFLVQRTTDAITWTDVGTVPAPLDQPNIHQVRTLTDPSRYNSNTAYLYRAVAQNTAGYGGEFMSLTTQSVSNPPLVVGTSPGAPTSLAATLQAGPQVSLTFTDTALNETGFAIQRSTTGVGGPFVQIATLPARNNTGSVTYVDTTIQPGTTYTYRVAAMNVAGTSTSNTVNVVVPAVPAAPSGFNAANVLPNPAGNNRTVRLTWTDNSNNETGFTIQRATNAGFTTGLNTANVAANSITLTQTGLSRNTNYYYRIRANNGTIISSAWVSAAPSPITTNP